MLRTIDAENYNPRSAYRGFRGSNGRGISTHGRRSLRILGPSAVYERPSDRAENARPEPTTCMRYIGAM